jgi:hypothetical protein
MTKLPPMPARDRAGMFSLNNPDDGTPIKEMFKLGESLLFVTEKCTYRMQLADQIDPQRKNPALPYNVHQKIFNYGITSELLCNTLLLAKVMFRKECQPQLDIDQAMHLAFNAFGELVAMHETAASFRSAEKEAISKAERLQQQDRSLAIPAVGNVRAQCKTFMQKADHFATALMNIVRLFYADQKGKNWDDFHELVTSQYGSDDNFSKVTGLTVPFLRLVRDARDCLEHHNKGVTTEDFHLQADGLVSPPTIEIDFRKSRHERCPVAWFMEETTKALLNAFEMIVVHTCGKNLKPFAGMPIVVGHLSDSYRAAWHVRFAYGMIYADGQFAPMG